MASILINKLYINLLLGLQVLIHISYIVLYIASIYICACMWVYVGESSCLLCVFVYERKRFVDVSIE